MLNLQELASGDLRFSRLRSEILEVYNLPITTLFYLAQSAQRRYFSGEEVQLSTLLSIKTGGCKENCSYCPQSAHYQTDVAAQRLMSVDTIMEAAREAKAKGSSRFCMGAAWRSPPKDSPQFLQVLEAVRGVRSLGMEVCTTLGMLDAEQAQQLAEAGVYAYNHNLDTSPEYYKDVISTRVYQDRLDTIQNVRKAGMTVCCGGIVGMGEALDDRIGLLQQLSQLDPHPESVPINLLVRVEGTPLADAEDLDVFDLARTIATAAIIMPSSRIRLSAGRQQMSDEAQALCFLAGASSIFTGEKLLTTPNPGEDRDRDLLQRLGLRPLAINGSQPMQSEQHNQAPQAMLH